MNSTGEAVLVAYRRTGGIAGTDDRIVVWSDGLAQVTGRAMRATTSRLPDARMEQLRSLLKRWDRLQSPKPNEAADAFVVEIYHGGRTVVVSDGSTPVPQDFVDVRNILEALAE